MNPYYVSDNIYYTESFILPDIPGMDGIIWQSQA